MIKTQNLTPDVFYKKSRDFQILGRIYDIVFNYLKTNIDTLDNLPANENVDDKLVDLVAISLGFKQSHNYNVKQLKSLCSIFTTVIRNKGNKQSIQLVLDMLTNIENSAQHAEIIIDNDCPYILKVFIPEDISDTTLFEDVLNYILPAGMSCTIIQQIALNSYSETAINVQVIPDYIKHKRTETSKVKKAKLNDDLSKLVTQYGRRGVIQDSTVVGAGQDINSEDDGD